MGSCSRTRATISSPRRASRRICSAANRANRRKDTGRLRPPQPLGGLALGGRREELQAAADPQGGEHLLNDIDMRTLGYECARYVAGERATHVFLRKRA